MTNKDNFLKGAAVLVIANFIVKIIGVVYKIPLTNIIGGEGMGYFSSAFDIYLMFFSLSTAGLPVALSKMVAESHSLGRYSEITKIIKVTFWLFATIGLLGTVAMFCGAEAFASVISNNLAKYSLMALAPALFFICIMSIFRGYFQGLQDMKPTAFSQVVEAVVKLVVGISLAIYAMNLGLKIEYVSAFGILGTTVSTIVSALILYIIFYSKKNKAKIKEFKLLGGYERSSRELIKALIKIVVPVTIGSVIVNLTGFLDLFLIINRLQVIGYTEEIANFMYGSYKACAYTLFNLPPSIIATFNLTLIPVITTAFTQKNKENLDYTANKSIKITALFSFPCAVAFVVFANPILNLMYPGKLEEIAVSTVLLQCLGVALPLVTISSMFTAILQSTGCEKIPVKSIIVASFVKIALNYVLIGIPAVNILGAPISTLACYLVIVLMNFYYIKTKTNISIDFKKTMNKSIYASIIMGAISYTFYFIVNIICKNIAISMIFTVPFAMLVYVIVIIKIKGITKEDFQGMKIPDRILRFLN